MGGISGHEAKSQTLLDLDDMNRNPLTREQSLASRRFGETAATEAGGEGNNEISCNSCGGRSLRVWMKRGERLLEKDLTCNRCGTVV